MLGFGIFLLFFNEGRAVRTAKGLAWGREQVVRDVAIDSVQTAHEGKLVHVAGQVTTDEILSDAPFGVTLCALALRRKVEMYQWVERSHRSSERQTGGSSRTVTTYSYQQQWSETWHNSNRFHRDRHRYHNPPMPFASQEQRTTAAKLGAFDLPGDLLRQLRTWTRFNPLVTAERGARPKIPAGFRVDGDQLYRGKDARNPEIGDVRVIFEVIKAQPVTVLAEQRGRSLEPATTPTGTEIYDLRTGLRSANDMITAAETENTLLTWFLRVAGFFVIFFGFNQIGSPLASLASVVPIVGRLVDFGVTLVAFLLAALSSMVTIGVAWLFHRPLLGVCLLGATAAVSLVTAGAAAGRSQAPSHR